MLLSLGGAASFETCKKRRTATHYCFRACHLEHCWSAHKIPRKESPDRAQGKPGASGGSKRSEAYGSPSVACVLLRDLQARRSAQLRKKKPCHLFFFGTQLSGLETG